MIWSIHVPPEQETPLQQSESVLQVCPYSAHPGVLLSGVPASRPDGGPDGGPGAPQVPWVVPIGWMQVVPTQQSPLIEHGPPPGTHFDGTPPSIPVLGGP
jgi:hypothetical protein